jgi:hypothetical protein
VIYFASPKTELGTERHVYFVRLVFRLYPDASIVDGLGTFRDHADWTRRWPEVLAKVTALVFRADRLRFIGKGTYQEIQDALERGIPVVYLAANGARYPWSDVVLSAPSEDSWAHYARVTPRGPIERPT